VPLYKKCTCKAYRYRRYLRSLPPATYHRSIGLDLGDFSTKMGWYQPDDGPTGTYAGQTVGMSLLASWSIKRPGKKPRRVFALGQPAVDRVQTGAAPTKVYYCLKRLLLN